MFGSWSPAHWAPRTDWRAQLIQEKRQSFPDSMTAGKTVSYYLTYVGINLC